MSDEKTETVLAEPSEPEGTAPVPEVKAAETVEELKAQLAKVEKSLKETNREAAERRKKLEAFERAEQERREAEMSEMDKLKLKAEMAEKELAETRLSLLKREVAAKFEMPEILIPRIMGTTKEELEADAEKLMTELPKPKPATVSATNPKTGSIPQETREQQLKRLFGSQN